MKAPDKIYIEVRHPFGNEFIEMLGFESRGNSDDIEYIRKDLLLEWAKAEIELSKRVECVSEKSYEEGRQQVAQNLIYKLNSM